MSVLRRKHILLKTAPYGQSSLDPWRKTWSLIKQYFMPSGNNATAIQAGKVSALWRRTAETFRTFMMRIDTEMAFLNSLGSEQPDYS